jgi:hypothetical protein
MSYPFLPSDGEMPENVAFRSAKDRSFRGAKGDIPAVIDSSVLYK